MLDYFVNNLEEWRKNMFKDKKIYLAGHSFGGFLGIYYKNKNIFILYINFYFIIILSIYNDI